MSSRIGWLMTMLPCLWTLAAAEAGIPEPDAVLYGEVRIDGALVRSSDPVNVVARVDGATEPVGSYAMGANSAAGDRYVLPIRLETLADGSTQSNNAAQVGQTASLFVKQNNGIEKLAGTLVLSDRGSISRLDLAVSLQTGSLQVTITPPEAVNAGAQWHEGEGAWQNSEATISGLSPGSHVVSFKEVEGWAKADDQTVEIVAGQTLSASGTYTKVPGTGAGQQQPGDEESQPSCGSGLCGAGGAGMVPFMFLALALMKVKLACRRPAG